jgi:O-antigen ligase
MHYVKTFIFLGSLLSTGLFLYRYSLSPKFRSILGLRPLAVVPVIALGLFTSSIWVYYAAILCSAVLIPRSRAEAVAMYLFLSFLLPQVPYDLKVGAVYITKLQGSLVASIGLLAAARFPVTNPNFKHKSHGLGLAALVFMVLLLSIDLRGQDVTATSFGRSAIELMLSLGIPFLAISGLSKERIDSRLPLFWFSAIGTILAWVAAFEMLRHWPLYQTIQSGVGSSSGMSKTLAVRGGLLRSPGPFFESTTFGLFLALATVISASLPSIFRNRISYFLVVAIGLFGCFATLSRNSWVGVTIGLLALGLFRGRIARSVGIGTMLAASLAAITFGTSNSGLSADLLGKGSSHAATTGEYRENLWSASLPLVRKSPLIGTPYRTVVAAMPSSVTSGSLQVDFVNSYLYFAVTSGLLGLLIFFIFLISPALSLWKRRARPSSAPASDAAAGFFSAHVALALMLFGTSFFERIPLMTVLLFSGARLLVGMMKSRNVEISRQSAYSYEEAGPGSGSQPRSSESNSSACIVEMPSIIVDRQNPTSRIKSSN